MLGYFIQALRNCKINQQEIEKILSEVFKLENDIGENEAKSIFYDFPE